ncbi:MAG: hypothetical protein HZA54_13625 [Planctomycetes bacterium]|nr:hypothetical protein [Planctomycetota bacterium]
MSGEYDLRTLRAAVRLGFLAPGQAAGLFDPADAGPADVVGGAQGGSRVAGGAGEAAGAAGAAGRTGATPPTGATGATAG